ncbi:MAG: hypothetical protein ACFFCD_03075 [Promethearchaeota archaeon]
MNTTVTQNIHSNGELLRTYKVGLRCPESLLIEFRDLMRRQQVLRFLQRVHCKRFTSKQLKNFEGLAQKYQNPKIVAFEQFKRYNSLQQATEFVISQYETLFDDYFSCSGSQHLAEIGCINARIAEHTTQDGELRANAVSKSAVPTFEDPANPKPTEISVHDYQLLANKSLKLICAHLNTFAVDNIDKLPETREELIQVALTTTKISKFQLNTRPYLAASAYLGSGRNIDQLAIQQMTAMMQVYRNTRNKVDYVRNLLYPEQDDATDFSAVVSILMSYYSQPKYFLYYLAKAWKVDLGWVRNTLVGWRRKVDPHLPIKFQVEPLTTLMIELADHCKAQVSSKDVLRVIGLLQKRHILHLIHEPSIDLAPLLPKGLWATYQALTMRLKGWTPALQQEIHKHCTDIGEEVFVQAGEQLYHSVEQNMNSLDAGSVGYQNSRSFLKKLRLILTNTDHFRAVFHYYLPGNKFTSAVAKLFTHMKVAKNHRATRLFTALRGVIALTFARIYDTSGATGQFKRVFTPENCVVRPYSSKKRTKSYLPVNLLSNKYVIERQAYPGKKKINKNGREVKAYLTNNEATELLKRGEPIWLGLPIYSPDQLQEGLLHGRKKTTFWFRVYASPKILACLNREAQVQSIRLNVPHGPTNKIVADIILAASDPSVFAHRGNFIAAWDRQFGSLAFPSGDYIGADFNRIGKYLIAAATAEQELDLTLPPNMMKPFQEAYDKLENIRKIEIPNIMRKLDSGKGSHQQRGRWKAQVTLLHRRRDRIMTEMKRQALMVYLYLIYRTGASYAAWDGIQGISTRGKKGALATGVTSLPKEKRLYETFLEWTKDLKAQGLLSKYQETRIVSPYTSQVCSECYTQGRGLRKTRANTTGYDEFKCTDSECGYAGNRHANSARMGALLLKQQIETTPLPLSTG